MDWKAQIRAALTSADDDVIEELAQHAADVFVRARADGQSIDEAESCIAAMIDEWRRDSGKLRRRSARRPAVAPPAAWLARADAAGPRESWSRGLVRDVRYACRLLGRQPAFLLLATLTMGLGIGTATTMFAVVTSVVLNPLPWPTADRVIVLKETRGGHAPRFGAFSNAAYLAWQKDAATVDEIAAWTTRTFTLTGSGDPVQVRGIAATASLFRVLEIRPLVGAVYAEDDETAPVVVLSESVWRQELGADPRVVGRAIRLDGELRTIVGVVADTAAYPDGRTRLYVPFRVPTPDNAIAMFDAVARLRPGASIAQAEAEAEARGRSVDATGMTTVAIFGGEGRVRVAARPLAEAVLGEVRRPLMILFGGVAVLLALATTNLVGLELTRATARRKELAIRAALGASSARVVRQSLAETLLLGLLGGGAGLLIAWPLQRAASAILPTDFPRASELGMGSGAVLFALGAAVFVSLVLGLLPAVSMRGVRQTQLLTEDSASSIGALWRSGVARGRLAIVAAQVAMACVLLIGAGLLGRTFLQLLHAERGYAPALVLSAPLRMPAPLYTPEQRAVTLQAVLSRLSATPGIRAAGFTSEQPWTPGGSTGAFTLSSPAGIVRGQASPRLVSRDYFAALGLRVLVGRGFLSSDTETSEAVAVVNQTFARQYLGNAPLKARIPLGMWGNDGTAAVVGVVEDVRYVRAGVTSLPEVYFASTQVRNGLQSAVVTLLLRGDGDQEMLSGSIRAAIRSADAMLAPTSIMTVQDRLLTGPLAYPRLYAALLTGFALAALAVAGVGLFSVLSFAVAQRTRELGIRSAIGARPKDLVVMVVSQGLGVTAAGLAVGLVVAAWLAHFMATLLYGVTTFDPVTYVVVPAILLLVAAMACLVPAWRAARLDPVRALRS